MRKYQFDFGFEYEEHADAFLLAAQKAGYEAFRDVRGDTIEGICVVADSSAEQELDRLAEQSFGHSLSSRPVD